MARVCVIRQHLFPLDTRVRREVAALEGAGHEVDVICLRGEGEAARERVGNVRVHRLSLSSRRGGRLRYVLEYVVFLLAAAAVAGLLAPRRRWMSYR